jgi:hypothetical protein
VKTQGWRRRFPALARWGSRSSIAVLFIAPALSVSLADPVSQIVEAQSSRGGTVGTEEFVAPAHMEQIAILDNQPASPYATKVEVSGLKGMVKDVNLILRGLNHDRPSDVSIMLEHQGRATVLMRQASNGTSLRTANIILNNDVGTPLPNANGGPLVGGKQYQPRDHDSANTPFGGSAPQSNDAQKKYLDFFDGLTPNGDWFLWVRDDKAPINGTLSGWQLEIITDNNGKFIASDRYEVKRGHKLKVPPEEGVLRNDHFEGRGNLSAHVKREPSKGNLRLFSNGGFIYNPKSKKFGTVEFTYRIKDELGSTIPGRGEVRIHIKRHRR